MRDRGPRKRVRGLGFNFTPLIDVMVLLTIFFMLVAKFTAAEHVTMELPHPEDSRAQVARFPERLVINCSLTRTPDASDLPLYSIGPNQPETLSAISDRLAAIKQQSPDVKVVIRADRRIPYKHVRAMMRVAAGNRIEVLNVAAVAGGSE